MKKVFVLAVCFFALIIALGAVGAGRGASTPPAGVAPVQAAPRIQMDFGQMPLYFIENRGQLDSRVGYYVQGKDKTLYFETDGVTFVLTKAVDNVRWVVKLDFLGANPDVRPVGEAETGAVISYFKGGPEEWKTGLQTYSQIVYRELWPGIDLIYSGTSNHLKSEFVVKQGANPAQIRLALRGAESVSMNGEGRLEVRTPVSSFQDDVPVAWQEANGVRREVKARYEPAEPKTATGGGERFAYGFELGTYDPALPLVLDPSIFIYCGYIGGSSNDVGNGIAVDWGGNAYVTGSTLSGPTSFPVTVGPDLTYNGGLSDAFVAKVNAAGTALVYCGYIGGSNADIGNGIAVDGGGNAYVTGSTLSGPTSFPVTVGPDLTYNGGISDAFVAKVNAAGTALVYCGYIGGSSADVGNGIAVDGSGNAYVTGSTLSTQATFPAAVGPDLTYNGGLTDAFVAKVNADGTALVYCGYIGGNNAENGNGIALDWSGNAYVTGTTVSSESSFPVAVGPDLTFNGGLTDAYVAKVNAAGTGLIYCGYIGGISMDTGRAIAVDRSGNAYLTGDTLSDETSFPVTFGPDLTYNGGSSDAFVAEVDSAGDALAYCGYIGGSDTDSGNGIAVDGAGNAHVTGSASSTEASFPVKGGPDLTFNGGGSDAYVAEVNATGRDLVNCSYIGGSGGDYGNGIALDWAGDEFLTGRSSSSESSFPVAYGPDLTYNGGISDAFVAEICAGWIRVTSPNGGEKWEVGSQHPITWLTGDKLGDDKLVYSTDKGETWKTIVFATRDDETYLWTVPNDLSHTVWVRVAEREGPGYDRSDKVFWIIPKPTLTVVSPNGGESWKAGTTQTIKWTTTGEVGDVKISYSVDGGTNWTTIDASAPNTGSYSWKIPAKPSTKCKVRIWEAADHVPSDVSDGTFTIKTE